MAPPWGLILAGGDGTRLQPWIQERTGQPYPKQFWPIRYGDTLLDLTRRRVAEAIPAERQVVVVTRFHQEYLEQAARRLAPARIMVQPSNRGTAPGILYPVVNLFDEEGDVPVAIFPSDHVVSDDRTFMQSVARATHLVMARPELVVLLGFEARAPETEYGWIEVVNLAAPVLGEGFSPVRRFWEKPPLAVAERLLAQGSLWNSFVMLGSAKTILQMAEATVPDLLEAFAPLRNLPSPARDGALDTIYAALPPRDFSRDILERSPGRLVALRVADVEWTDLGTPRRVIGFFEATQRRPRWATVPSGALESAHPHRRRMAGRRSTDRPRRKTA
jgi:mannose-1-phosphate guanylyltransferase